MQFGVRGYVRLIAEAEKLAAEGVVVYGGRYDLASSIHSVCNQLL